MNTMPGLELSNFRRITPRQICFFGRAIGGIREVTLVGRNDPGGELGTSTRCVIAGDIYMAIPCEQKKIYHLVMTNIAMENPL